MAKSLQEKGRVGRKGNGGVGGHTGENFEYKQNLGKCGREGRRRKKLGKRGLPGGAEGSDFLRGRPHEKILQKDGEEPSANSLRRESEKVETQEPISNSLFKKRPPDRGKTICLLKEARFQK